MSKKNWSVKSKINVKASTVHIAVLGLLTALATALALFTIRPNESIKISLTFIPVAIAAYIYGPVGGGTVAGLADIIGCIVKPSGMIYPPITLTEILIGVIFGLLLHKNRRFPRIALAAGITQLIISAFVTPLWLHLLYGMDYVLLLWTRIPQLAIMVSAELIVIPLILKTLEKINIEKLLPGILQKSAVPSKNASPKKEQ